MSRCAIAFAWFFALCITAPLAAEKFDGNRLTYLDDFCDPYYVGRDFPKLITPQWVGEEGVEAVIVLAIDDMRGHQRWEEYLRPIIDRLKKIDGRAPISIMTCTIDPKEPHLQTWLKEGLSIEVHTIDHPCPCLERGLDGAAKTYHDCADLMASVPNNHPVAFRMPCCDSQNTPSPRFWAEVFNGRSSGGKFLEIDSSVFNITTPADDSLPRELVLDTEGKPRFRRYLPFPSFVNTIEDYPYPYVIGRLCWQFPCVVPSDWSAQHVQKPNNPQTVADMKLALDAVVAKRGVYNLVFHPHGWIRNDQINEIIDYAVEKHGKKVKFLNFRECAERLNQNLLAGQPLRDKDGGDNGVRLLDVNADGIQDVVIGNATKRLARIWLPGENRWQEAEFPVSINKTVDGRGRDDGVRFGVLDDNRHAMMLVAREGLAGAWRWREGAWRSDDALLHGLIDVGSLFMTIFEGVDSGARFRDLDGDGHCELIAAGPKVTGVRRWSDGEKRWERVPFVLPDDPLIVDEEGRDAGLRFVDFNGDGRDDIIFSNQDRWAALPWISSDEGWARRVSGNQGEARAIPPIVRGKTNNGAWFHSGHLWVQNEDTIRLADKVARLPLKQIAAWIDEQPVDPANVKPQSPEESLRSMKVRPGLKVQLVAAEPLIVDPIAFDWGPDGRLWVVEMRDYPLGMDGKGKPGGRVKVLTDTDNDGHYDKADVFLDDLPYPTGVKVWRSGVLVTVAPKIIYAEDTTGDNRADKTETLYEGFGEGNQQHRVNGLRWGLDNWLYVGNGDSGGNIRSLKTGEEVNVQHRDLRIRPDDGSLQAISGNTQYGINRDDWGNWFGGNNSTPAWHYVLDDVYLRRNPHFAPPGVRRDISVTPGAARVYPSSRTFERFNDPGRANHFTSACSPEIYRDRVLGEEFYGNVFVCEPVHNLVHREVVTADGSTFKSQRAQDEQESEFLASTDNWFRPTMVRTGPDGALWVADMYRLVIEHPQWIPKDWQERLNLRAGDDRGRIYRIVPDKGEPLRVPRLDKLDIDGLTKQFHSPNGPVRDLAQQMLVWRRKDEVADSLLTAWEAHRPPAGRLQLLCTLDGTGCITSRIVEEALLDEDPLVRRHAVRLSEQFIKTSRTMHVEAAKKMHDEDARVHLQLAYIAGQWSDHEMAGFVLAKLLASEDQYVRAAATSSLTKENVGHIIAFSLTERTPFTQERFGELLAQAAALGAGDALLPALRRLSEPDQKNRFAARQMESAALVLEQLSHNDSLKHTLAEAHKQLAPMFTQARETLTSDDPPERLVAALKLLQRATFQERPKHDIVLPLLRPLRSPEVQTAALQTLMASGGEVVEQVFAGWRTYTPALRLEIIDACLTQPAHTQALLAAIEAETISPRQLDALRRRQLLEHRDEDVRGRAAKLLADTTPSSRAKVLEQYAEAMKVAGDAGRGKELFTKHCSACHRLDETGNAVGPDLATLTNRSPEVLLAAILDPNRAVEDKFLNYTAVTRDGRVLSGMLVAESGGSLTLQSAEGKTLDLLRKDLEEFASSEKSFMPEGLEQDIPVAAMADVLAYVRSAGGPPKAFEENKPEIVRAGDDGALHLRATSARIYGKSLIFEPHYKNLGYWQSAEDRASWTLVAPQAGEFQIEFDYACDNGTAGNVLVLELGSQQITSKVEGTGTWDNYRWQKIGKLKLVEGQQEISIHSDGEIRGAMIDLREVRLTLLK